MDSLIKSRFSKTEKHLAGILAIPQAVLFAACGVCLGWCRWFSEFPREILQTRSFPFGKGMGKKCHMTKQPINTGKI